MKQKKTDNGWKLTDKIIFGILLASSLIFLFLISKVLPLKFWLVITVLLALINLIVFLKLYSYNRKARKIGQKEGTGIRNPYVGKKRRTKLTKSVKSVDFITDYGTLIYVLTVHSLFA